MGELWAKAKPWAVGIACGWVLLAFVFLCASVEHPLFSVETASKIYKAVSDIVLLKWVSKYQTLLAGLAALVGGLAAIWSTKLKIESDKLLKKEERFILVKNDLIIAAQVLIDIKHAVDARKESWKALDRQIYYSVNQCDHLLGTFFSIFVQEINDGIDRENLQRMKAEADVLCSIILHFSNNFDDVRNCSLPFTGHHLEVTSVTIAAISKEHDIDVTDLKHYQRYFPDTIATT